MLVGHLCLNHNVEERLFLRELKAPDLGAPRLEAVLLQAEVVVENSELARVLGGLKLLFNGGVKVVLGLVAESGANTESVGKSEHGTKILLDRRIVALEDSLRVKQGDL